MCAAVVFFLSAKPKSVALKLNFACAVRLCEVVLTRLDWRCQAESPESRNPRRESNYWNPWEFALQHRWPLFYSQSQNEIKSDAFTLQNRLPLINCLLRLNGAFNNLSTELNCIVYNIYSKEIFWSIWSSKVIIRNHIPFVDAKIHFSNSFTTT